VIGISSDILCPPAEQAFLAKHLSDARLEIIDSPYGHDGFLIEFQQITSVVQRFFSTDV
jgi:homoserine O-acetyltransferase